MGRTMFEFKVCSFEAKNRVFEFNYQKMNTFEFVRCSKIDVRVRSMFVEMVFDKSLKRRAASVVVEDDIYNR